MKIEFIDLKSRYKLERQEILKTLIKSPTSTKRLKYYYDDYLLPTITS